MVVGLGENRCCCAGPALPRMERAALVVKKSVRRGAGETHMRVLSPESCKSICR